MIITGNLIIKQILNALVLEGENFNNYVKSQMDFIDTDDLLDTIPIIMNHKSFDIQYLANNDSLNEKILLEAYKDTTKRNMYYKMYGTFGNIRLLDNEIKILEEIMIIRNIDFNKGNIKMRLNRDSYVVKTINSILITNFYEKVNNSFLLEYDIKLLTWDYCNDTNLIVVIKNDNSEYCFETPKDAFYLSDKKTTYDKINQIVDIIIECIKKRGK